MNADPESGRRDSNPRHPPWQGGALPTALRPHTLTIARLCWAKSIVGQGYAPKPGNLGVIAVRLLSGIRGIIRGCTLLLDGRSFGLWIGGDQPRP